MTCVILLWITMDGKNIIGFPLRHLSMTNQGPLEGTLAMNVMSCCITTAVIETGNGIMITIVTVIGPGLMSVTGMAWTENQLKRNVKKRENELIIETERSKAKLNNPTGKIVEYHYTCDDEFFYLSLHVDKVLRDKIKNGEIDIDLSKLIIKRKLSCDNKLEIVNKDGCSFFIPSSDKEIPNINCFQNGSRHFRVFSGIYTKDKSDRVHQLYQYADTISLAADNYVWDNVCTYDKLFH